MANTSLQFSGAGSDYVTVPDGTSLELTTPFTIAFWLKVANSGLTEILEKGNIGSTGSYLIELGSTRKVQLTIPGVVNIGGGGSVIPQNLWTHIAITRSGTAYVFYINGRQDQAPTDSHTITANSATLIIGRRSSVTTSALNGILDEVVLIKGTALTAAQVATLYSQHISPVAASAEWDFNEGSGTTTADASGNGNTGTLVGSPTWSSDAPGLTNKFGFFNLL